MNAKRVFFIMLSGTIILVGACAGITYFAHQMLVREGDSLAELKLEEEVLNRQSDALAQAKKDIAEYEDLEIIAKTVVPQEKDQARTVLEIVKLAQESGITITSIEFPDSLLGEAIKKSAANSDAKPVNTVDANTTQLTPLKDLKGVYAMEIRVQSDNERPISYQQLLTFLQKLENNRRTAQVIDISITPSDENRNLLNFSVTLNSYVKP